MEWQQIDAGLYRTRIPGGWLVMHETTIIHHGIVEGLDQRTSICFVPDEGHYWQILNKNEA